MLRSSENGFALLISLIVLALFCLMSFYLAVNAATEIRISDNFEAEVRARFAAYAGLDHARAALRGLSLNDLLQGPDGTYDTSPGYAVQARALSFRNPIPWAVAQTLDVRDPDFDVTGMSDDGLINTGLYLSIPGTTLISQAGVPMIIPDAREPSGVVAARYFVKVTDNNGEASERAGDPLDSPFIDGDGLIIVRSTGVAPSIREHLPGSARNNSVVVFEGRYRRLSTFDADATVVVQGISIEPSGPLVFEGNSFLISGGTSNPGIAVLDPDRFDVLLPLPELTAQVAAGQENCIQGSGSSPSIVELTSAVASDRQKALLLNEDYLWSFTRRRVKRFADSTFLGDQDWAAGSPDLGFFDSLLPMNAPGQRPRVTFVDGSLTVGGGASGAGLLVVTGRLSAAGPFTFTGLILVVGAGDLNVGEGCTISGSIYVASIEASGTSPVWGVARMSFSGGGRVIFDRAAIRMAIALIPPDQVGFREITSSLDP